MKMILSSVGFEPTNTLGVAELKSHILDRSALLTMKNLQSSWWDSNSWLYDSFEFEIWSWLLKLTKKVIEPHMEHNVFQIKKWIENKKIFFSKNISNCIR